MQWLAALCVKRPVFASVLILSLTVIGVFSFTRLGVDRFPKVDIPTVVVTTVQPGAAPEQIETEITDKIEEAVNTISGIDELRSVSSEGISQVIIAFTLDKDTDVGAQEVRDKVNGVLPLLPKTIQQPRVDKFDPDAAPVLSLALSANRPIRDITEYADKVLRRQLESVDGIGQVLIVGGRERQINIWLDADRLRAYNLTVTDVALALESQNVEIPGGRVEQGPESLTLRTRGRVQRPSEFGDIVVRQKDGHPVRVMDVADVEDGQAEPDDVANVDGKSTVLLNIRRQSGTNTVEVVKGIRDRLTSVRAGLPPGYDLRIVRDLSEFIEASIHNVEEHLVIGSILAALVVLLFLTNLRSTIIAAIAIPTSIVATFGLVWYMDFTLNMLTMLALTLSVGIVIDDAIVVLENIYRFIEEKHEDQLQAAIDATDEIGLAVLATTLSLVAIFVPVGFMGGIVGRFMKSFGLTMAFAIMVSLLVSFTLTPMMSARWLKVGRHGKDRHSSKESRVFHAVDVFYTRLLNWSMGHRAVVAGIAVLVLLSSVPLFSLANKNFLPLDDQSEFEINLRAAEGTSLESTEVITNRLATAVRQRLQEVAYTLVTVGGDAANTRNASNIYVRLKPIEDRTRDQFEVMGIVRDEILPPIAGDLRTSVQQVATIGGGGSQAADVQFVVNGPDLKKLDVISRQLVARAKTIPGVVDLDTSLNVGKPELSVELDRPKAADLGVQIGDAAEALRLLVGGDQVTTYNEGGEQYRSASAGPRGESHDRSRHRGADGALLAARQRVARQRGQVRAGHGAVRHQPPRPPAPGDGVLQPPAVRVAGRGAERDSRGVRLAQGRQRLSRRLRGALEGARSNGAEFRPRVRTVAHLHVPHPGGAVRVVAASGDDSAVAPADAALRPSVDHRLPAVAEHLLGARAARAVRRGEEELDSADRSRESAQGARPVDPRRDRAGQPGSSPAHSDDDARVRGRHDSADRVARHRFRDQPRHRVRDLRRPVARAAPDAARHARGVLALRRRFTGARAAASEGRGARDAAGRGALAGDGQGSASCVSRCPRSS